MPIVNADTYMRLSGISSADMSVSSECQGVEQRECTETLP